MPISPPCFGGRNGILSRISAPQGAKARRSANSTVSLKHFLLLDNSTVKERILEIRDQGLCVVDPPDGALSARSVMVPAPTLLELFDRHLLAFGKELAATAVALDPTTRIRPPRNFDPQLRSIILQALNKCREPWRAALDRIFDTNNLSRARRVEAIRHLSSLSHWTLLHMAVELRYDLSTFAGNEQGVLADQMAASLLNLTGRTSRRRATTSHT